MPFFTSVCWGFEFERDGRRLVCSSMGIGWFKLGCSEGGKESGAVGWLEVAI